MNKELWSVVAIVAVILIAASLMEYGLYALGITSPISVHSASTVYSTSILSQGGYPVNFTNVTPNLNRNGNITGVTIAFKNPTNYTVYYYGGCFSPFTGRVILNNTVVNVTYITGAACDAIATLRLSAGESGKALWPYPKSLNITKRGNYTLELNFPYSLVGPSNATYIASENLVVKLGYN